MKKVFCVVCCMIALSVAIAPIAAMAEELPESVQRQVRKGSKESEGWNKFDQSGPVKFLQVEHTAAASEAGSADTLDGSFGERLIEVLLDTSVEAEAVAWTLENKGPGTVYVVAFSDGELQESIKIEPDTSAEFSTKVAEAYCYIVVDSDGKDETTLKINAKAGDAEAKTVRGKSMSILWF